MKKRLILCIVLLVLVQNVFAVVQPPLRINSAGQAYTDTSGKLWLADKEYSSGSWGYVGGQAADRTQSGLDVMGTTSDALFLTERWGLSSYQFDLPNGDYDVRLYFAETNTWFNTPGRRIFNVAIEGSTVLDNFDPSVEASFAHVISKSYKVAVTDNQLNINFYGVVDNPIINAVEILDWRGLIGDTNGDGRVTLADLIIFITNFGKTGGYDAQSDVNADGKVNLFDIVLVAKNIGEVGPSEPVCGNGLCEGGETCSSCQGDCGICPPTQYCGNSICDSGEDCNNCQQDCGECLSAGDCTHFVTKSGSDTNSGTSLSNAWRTISKGVGSISAGNVLCVRTGTYHEKVTISISGTSSNPITIMAYPGDKPVVDGEAGVSCTNCGLPSGSMAKIDPRSGKGHNWAGLVHITGNHIVFDGFEVKRSLGRGILIGDDPSPEDVTVKNCDVNYARSAGIITKDASDVVVEGCKVWRNADFATYSRGSGTLNWPVIVSVLKSDNVVLRNNEIFNNWGEGLTAGKGSSNVLIEGNVIYDNYALQAYTNRAQYVTIRGNLMYFSDDPEFHRRDDPSSCLVLNNEIEYDQSRYSGSRDVTIINNLFMGCKQNIGMWAQGSTGNKAGTPNVLIAHNTLINAFETGIYMTKADNPPYTAIIKNNIIIEQSGTVASIASGQDVTWSNNLWWPNSPGSSASGSGDVYSDPRLSMSGSTSAGQLSPGYFKISSSSSPAIGKAKVDSDSVSIDYFGKNRDSQPDIGAHEYP